MQRWSKPGGHANRKTGITVFYRDYQRSDRKLTATNILITKLFRPDPPIIDPFCVSF